MVEDMMRLHSPMDGTLPQVVKEDMVIGGQRVNAGGGVIVAISALNALSPTSRKLTQLPHRPDMKSMHVVEPWRPGALGPLSELQIALAALSGHCPNCRRRWVPA